MFILGISAFYHDSAACLLYNDQIVAAAQEERFTRIKNDAAFPSQAINYCLQQAGIRLTDIQHVVFYEKPFLKFERLLETHLAFAPKGFVSFMKSMPVWLKSKLFLKNNIKNELKNIDPNWKADHPVLFTDHHQSHAASAFYPSPFNEAVILTIDGVGEWATTTVSIGKGKNIKLIQEINFPHSLGLLYSAFTYYLGFKVNSDEYKVMGLAPYGQPVFVNLIKQHLIDIKDDGSFWLDMEYFGYCTGLTMTNKNFDKLFGTPARNSKEEILQFHKNIARSIQQVTEDVLLKMTRHLAKLYPATNLCMAGGVALNCVANAVIRKYSGFKEVWVQPAAGDAGGALGAAFSIYHEYLNNEKNVTLSSDSMRQSLLGPAFSKDDVKTALNAAGYIYEEPEPDSFYLKLAQYLAEGKVVGYFSGRAEFGPRALGCRSILADPRNADMQSILNQKIKFRESFRPFAPAVLEEYATDYFVEVKSSPYMLFTAQSAVPYKNSEQSNSNKANIPAVVHIDGSARVQTVSKVNHPDFYRVIKSFHTLTNCTLLINTSFNVMNEPIVNTPADAIRCFEQTGIDVLAIEKLFVTKTS